MKKSVSTIWFLVFFFNMTVLVYEHTTIKGYHSLISAPAHGMPSDSAVLDLIDDETKFEEYSEQTLKIREHQTLIEILKLLAITGLSAIFIFGKTRRKASELLDRQMNIIDDRITASPLSEINISVLFFVLCVAIDYSAVIMSLLNSQPAFAILASSVMIVLILAILPFVATIFLNLLEKYGTVLIIVLYISHISQMIYEFLSQKNVNLNRMEQVSIEMFAPATQNLLKEMDLADRVYREREQSKSVNAALVGWGAYERIEIYGNYEQFSIDEFNAILLHEIGHSKDHSLFKKFGTHISIVVLELFIMLSILWFAAPSYERDGTSRECAFILMAIMYIFLARHWLQALHHLVSQKAEEHSDTLAWKKGYNVDLASVLFRIAEGSWEYLRSTYLYNLLHNYHPTIYERLERLLKE